MTNLAIAGSRRLPRGQAPRLLIRCLATLSDDSTVFLRSPVSSPPGTFEQDVANLCAILGLRHEWVIPDITDTTRGRASVYLRDITLVDKVDLVLLFFTPSEAHDGYSGTAHLLEKALDAARPVYAYTVADDGAVERVGEYDPDDAFSGVVPAPSGSAQQET